MNSGMDHVSCNVQEPALSTPDDFALFIHMDEVGGLDQTKRNTERIHPECRGVDGIAESDVARDSLVESQFAEDTKGS